MLYQNILPPGPRPTRLALAEPHLAADSAAGMAPRRPQERPANWVGASSSLAQRGHQTTTSASLPPTHLTTSCTSPSVKVAR